MITDTNWIVDEQFDIIFYPDLGMKMESIWLANKRLAPIQIASYGHPVSSYGALVSE